MAADAEHHSEGHGCGQHGCSAFAYERQRLSGDGEYAAYDGHVEQGLDDDVDAASYHEEAGGGAAQAHGHEAGAPEEPQVAQQEEHAEHEAALFDDDGEDVVAECERQACVLA